MADPAPQSIAKSRVGRDNEHEWWDDCVELLFDPAGKNEGDFYHFVITAGGHSAGVSVDQHIQDDADELTFLWTETGSPGRSPSVRKKE